MLFWQFLWNDIYFRTVLSRLAVLLSYAVAYCGLSLRNIDAIKTQLVIILLLFKFKLILVKLIKELLCLVCQV